MSVVRLTNYIAGIAQAPASLEYLNVIQPATGEVHAEVPVSSSQDVEAAVQSGREAFPGWSRLPAAERAGYLLRLADLIERDVDSLARAESDDTGKPLSLARSLDIPRASANLRYFAAAAQAFHSESHPTPSAIQYTLRKPLGVVASISPWNLPLYLLTWKFAPALAVGNTVIAKPSELTPVTATRLSALCQEAKLPPGVLNIVHGPGAVSGQALVDHPAVAAISFTGGTVTGKAIAVSAASTLKKFSLELGGKNPTLIFADCDYEVALTTSVRAAFANQGEICLCGSRIYVEQSIYERFLQDFVERTSRLIVGDPLDPETDLGAVISEPHLQKLERFAQVARDEGGTIHCGGRRLALSGRCAKGSFFAPTVVSGLGTTCHFNQAEIFGPLVSILPFASDADVVEQANGTPYGLSASLWTRNLARGHRIADALEAGVVWVNCWMVRDLRTPFGGMKQSGMGREGGQESLRFFTEPKNVCVHFGE